MRQFPPLQFQGGHTASMSLPSGAPPTYADTLSSAVTSNKTKEDQRRQATQTRTARPATDERTAAPKTQRNSTSGTLPRKRTLADRRIPKKTLRWDKTNVPFLSKLAITFSLSEDRSNNQRQNYRRDTRNNYRRQGRNYSNSKGKKGTRKRNNSAPVTQPPF